MAVSPTIDYPMPSCPPADHFPGRTLSPQVYRDRWEWVQPQLAAMSQVSWAAETLAPGEATRRSRAYAEPVAHDALASWIACSSAASVAVAQLGGPIEPHQGWSMHELALPAKQFGKTQDRAAVYRIVGDMLTATAHGELPPPLPHARWQARLVALSCLLDIGVQRLMGRPVPVVLLEASDPAPPRPGIG